MAFNGTWADWTALSKMERDALRDTSNLHPKLIGLEGKRVRVTPKREYGLSTFRVGISTGWKPIHMAMRTRIARGSSDTIRADERFDSVTVLD